MAHYRVIAGALEFGFVFSPPPAPYILSQSSSCQPLTLISALPKLALFFQTAPFLPRRVAASSAVPAFAGTSSGMASGTLGISRQRRANWLCFFAPAIRPNPHKNLLLLTLRQFSPSVNWLCFFKLTHSHNSCHGQGTLAQRGNLRNLVSVLASFSCLLYSVFCLIFGFVLHKK